MPSRLTDGDTRGVRNKGISLLAETMEAVEDRLAPGTWWYGADWSIVDVYLCWAYSLAESTGFPLASFPSVITHRANVRERPGFQRAIKRERAALDLAGLAVPDFFGP